MDSHKVRRKTQARRLQAKRLRLETNRTLWLFHFTTHASPLSSARMNPHSILWIYIVLLVIGGLIGFFKGKSSVSLIMSVSFAAALAVCAINGLLDARLARTVADALMVALLVVFAIRLAKTKKFMPAGMMLIVTLAALVLRHF